MDPLVKEIVEARATQQGAFLQLTIDGDCFLWDREPSSKFNKMMLACWKLDDNQCDELIDSGIVDYAT